MRAISVHTKVIGKQDKAYVSLMFSVHGGSLLINNKSNRR